MAQHSITIIHFAEEIRKPALIPTAKDSRFELCAEY